MPLVLEMGLETEIASSSGWAPDLFHGGEGHRQPELACPCSRTAQDLC